jgi:hypothetical protein
MWAGMSVMVRVVVIVVVGVEVRGLGKVVEKRGEEEEESK